MHYLPPAERQEQLISKIFSLRFLSVPPCGPPAYLASLDWSLPFSIRLKLLCFAYSRDGTRTILTRPLPAAHLGLCRMHFLPFLFVGAIIAGATMIPSSKNNGPTIHEFASPVTYSSLRYVNNSGICETTPGVHTMSGYVDTSTTVHTWFWFFAARHDPQSAPIHVVTTELNPHTWNTVSNMIYIDQPTGTGFSYGTDTINSTYAAAPAIWRVLQTLFSSPEFSAYQSREFILATESYGGHYGPKFAQYFEVQNNLIAGGKLNGIQINLVALMINNGWIDPLIQYQAYVTFAQNAPGYGPLVNQSTVKRMNDSYYNSKGCLAQQRACYNAGNSGSSNGICSDADDICASLFLDAVGNRDPYDLRQNSSEAFPPEAIGAISSNYSECPYPPQELFSRTSDDARTLLPQLGNVLVWAGDTDIICNWVGNQAVVLAMQWSGKAELNATPLTNITLSGKTIAAVQNVKKFSFARVYAAGHEGVSLTYFQPAFQPAAALAIFKQIIAGQPLHSV
ncbi:Alpha/Beta hydrolase protein [Favolaschia claudopus]|uniref:Carboxypeptidase n=1 Tax=Favolaschia claudopus TaxID=2862362 RepID=A0AAV9ZI64_9AGAR